MQMKGIVRRTATDELSLYRRRVAGKLRARRKKLRIIDLFSGAGGLSLGFTKYFGHNSFKHVWANDINETAVATYNLNLGGHCEDGDLTSLISDPACVIPIADVVMGGPPCQGFSLLNRNRKGDPRNQLWRPFLRVVQDSCAELFLMENVPQLLGSSEYDEIMREATSLGFAVVSAKLCAADYGVPQTRVRGFILGCRVADPQTDFPPRKTHGGPNVINNLSLFKKMQGNGYVESPAPWRTVRDSIADLPHPAGTEISAAQPPLNLHFGRNPTDTSKRRYKAIPREGMNRFDLQRRAPELTPDCWIRKTSGGTDLFGRLWWDRPAFTIRTEFFKPEKGRYLHPVEHRPITHREAARLQTFPDSFLFVGSKIEIAKQIGNAVPPTLAARIADSILAILSKRD